MIPTFIGSLFYENEEKTCRQKTPHFPCQRFQKLKLGPLPFLSVQINLSLVRGPFFNNRLSLGYPVIAQFDHFDDQEGEGKRNIERKRQLKQHKGKGREDQEKETKEEERTNQT